MMEAPILSPAMALVTVCNNMDPVLTADTSALLANCPATSRSIAPYSDCRNKAASTGSANFTNLKNPNHQEMPSVYPKAKIE